jgi:hypothetical protein
MFKFYGLEDIQSEMCSIHSPLNLNVIFQTQQTLSIIPISFERKTIRAKDQRPRNNDNIKSSMRLVRMDCFLTWKTA